MAELSVGPERYMLVDVNNFYCSAERLDLKLRGVPVVVLSNADGCAVARSNESKALGIAMGQPWFQFQHVAKKHGIVCLSSNYALYQDMSDRVTTILRDMCPDLEIYSIDESFLRVEKVAQHYGGIEAMGHAVKNRILQWTTLPVCAGAGPTKTLAKFANFLAKKNAVFNGVCDLFTLPKADRLRWMAATDVGEVWGVGSRIAKRLRAMDINTVLDLRRADPKTLRAQFGVVMERTGNELRGISCLSLEEVTPPRKQIVVSRSFGAPVTTLAQLRETLSTYTSLAAEKLRSQHSRAGAVQIFIHTNPFKDAAQYSASRTMPLVEPSDDTRELLGAALAGLNRIFKPGFDYKKSGVMLIELTDRDRRQQTLFEDAGALDRSRRLMTAIDKANHEFGRNTVKLAAAGVHAGWAAKQSRLSPRYTTRWADLPIVR